MFITIRKLTVTKGNVDRIVERFNQTSPVDGFEGLLKKDLLLNSRGAQADIFSIILYWESKESFAKWHTSDAHREAHKNSHNVKHEEVISVEKEAYEVVATKDFPG